MLTRYFQRLLALLVATVGLLHQATTTIAAGKSYDLLLDQEYIEREAGPLKADLYVPRGDGPFPAMIVVHGGAWASGTKAQLAGIAKGLAEHGYTAAAINYRLAPKDTFPAQIYDCQAAVRWLRENAKKYKVDPSRVGGYGYSAGGHLVALLGALDDDDFRETGVSDDAPSARLQVVVAGGAPCDFRVLPADSKRIAYWLGGTPAEKPDAYREASPASYVTADDPPMFFFHGGVDNLVPIRNPRQMVEQLKAADVPVEFYEVPEANHMGAFVDGQAVQQGLAFLDRYLKEGSTNPSGAGDGPARSGNGEPEHVE